MMQITATNPFEAMKTIKIKYDSNKPRRVDPHSPQASNHLGYVLTCSKGIKLAQNVVYLSWEQVKKECKSSQIIVSRIFFERRHKVKLIDVD